MSSSLDSALQGLKVFCCLHDNNNSETEKDTKVDSTGQYRASRASIVVVLSLSSILMSSSLASAVQGLMVLYCRHNSMRQ